MVLQGTCLFVGSIKHLSAQELQEAVLMKHAARETRHYWVMASARKLKEAEHYAKLVGFVHARDCKEYEESSDEGRDDAEDFMAVGHEVYNEELISFNTTNIQLDQLEDEI